VDDGASLYVVGSAPAPSVDDEEAALLEVTVANVGGHAAAPEAAEGAGDAAGGGASAVGAGPGAGTSRPQRQAGEPAQPAALVLIAVPGQEPPADSSAGSQPAGAGGASGGGRPLRRVEFRNRGIDLWKRWPDANFRNIAGREGVDALNRAFELLEDSDAHSVADDLFRKGIRLSFGEPGDFSEADAPAARFISPAGRPPDPPIPPPTLTLNPKFLGEDPRVLAAILAHEGTHFQQYLDGTIQRADSTELEAQAWTNGAVMWQQMRHSALALNTPLVRDLEVGYQIARQGEALLHDFVAALYTHEPDH
jgi:hypothetical protein